MKQTSYPFIPSVNFHLWEPCNMRCKFCFATFKDVKQSILPKGHLSKDKALQVVRQIAAHGFQKITFAGGEPTLCPWLPELIALAKYSGMTTMLVTNGSLLNESFLKENKIILDWVAISIDSLNDSSNLQSGRTITSRKPFNSELYHDLVLKVKQYEYGLKINTVVHRKNYQQNMSNFIQFAKPQRWKILQVLPILGQNDTSIEDFTITEQQFLTFLSNNSAAKLFTQLVPEQNSQIMGSYVMIDPAGRFFDNNQGRHRYSDPILEVGVENALKQVQYDLGKFKSRGGVYSWNRDAY